MIYKYRDLEPDEYIVIAGDPAEGHDNSAFVAISKKNADVVLVGQSKEDSASLGHTLNHVGLYIESRTGLLPIIGVERNVGGSTINTLKNLNYRNLFKMPQSFTKDTEEATDDYGWITSMATRPKMLDELSLALKQNALTIPSKPIIDEMFSFIRHQKTGKPQADSSSNDDLVMATAIAWQMYQIVPLKSSHDIIGTVRRNAHAQRKWSI
jgi:hypothetical protein